MRKVIKRQKQPQRQPVSLTPELKAWADKWIRHSPLQMVRSTDVKDKLPPTYANAEAAQMAWIDAACKIEQGFTELQANAAAGNSDALGALVQQLHDAADWLCGFSYRQTELVRQIARRRFQWPVLWVRHPQFEKSQREYLTEIQLGEEDPYHSKSKAWGKGWGGKFSVATIWAMEIQATIEENKSLMVHATPFASRPEYKPWWDAIPQWAKDCATLRPLSKETAAKWFAIGWQAILEHTNDKPEGVAELQKLGENRKKHSEHTGQQKRATANTSDVNIRARIKERIGQALHSLAPSGNTPA